MKNSTVLKESLFAALLIVAILFFASVVVVSYAGASSIVQIGVQTENQDGHAHASNPGFLISGKLAKSSVDNLKHLKKVAQGTSTPSTLV